MNSIEDKVRCYDCGIILIRDRLRRCCGYTYPKYPEPLPEMRPKEPETRYPRKTLRDQFRAEERTRKEEEKLRKEEEKLRKEQEKLAQKKKDRKRKASLKKGERLSIVVRDEYTCQTCNVMFLNKDLQV